MRKKAIVLAIGAVLVAPSALADVELFGKAVQVYGKIHLSVDSYDRGTATASVTDPSDTEVASNASRLGFKGEVDLDDALKAVWKFESEVDFSGESTEFGARDRYLGLKGSFGQFLVGNHDTPLKKAASAATLFGDTVADRRSILGQTSSGDNQFNQRAKNMLMYQFKGDALAFDAMLANDFEDVADADTSTNQLTSLGISWKSGPLYAALAHEKQEGIDGTANKDANGTRAGLKYDFGPMALLLAYETLSDKGFGTRIDRDAWGLGASFKLGAKTRFEVQYLTADKSKAGNDGADMAAIGLKHKVGKKSDVYVMYASLDNDPNASYRLARSGHGQSFNPTLAGETVKAFSVGFVHGF